MPGNTDTERNDTRDIVRGALVNFIGIVARSLNFAFFLVLGRLYGPGTTGLYLLCWTTIDVLSKLGILGIDRSVLIRAATTGTDGDSRKVAAITAKALVIGIALSALLSTGLILVAPSILADYYNRPEMSTPVRIMAVGIPFWAISAAFIAATRAARVMKYEVIIKSGLEPLVLLVGAVAFNAWEFGVTGLAISFVISTLVGALAAAWFYSRRFSLRQVLASLPKTTGTLRLVRYTAPIGLYDMLNLILQRVGLYLLGLYAPVAAVGIYGLAEEAAFTVKKVRQAFDPILLPVISANVKRGGRHEALSQYRKVTRWILTLDLAALAVLLFAGESILALFGPEFPAGTAALQVLVLSIVINGVAGVAELFILIDRPTLNLLNTIGAIGVNIMLGVWLIPNHGMLGAAAAICFTYALMNLARLLEVWWLYRMQPFTRKHLMTAFAFIAAMLPPGFATQLLPASTLRNLMLALLALGLYAALLWLLNLVAANGRIRGMLVPRTEPGDPKC